MPIVHVSVWEGFGQSNARKVIQGVTKVFVDMGIPQHAVEVVVREIPKSHWGVAGVPASERLKDESPPPTAHCFLAASEAEVGDSAPTLPTTDHRSE